MFKNILLLYIQGSGLKQSSVGKAHGSHMWSLKVHEIITDSSSKIWHSICDVSDTGVPYIEYKTKNPLFFICRSVMPWEYDAVARYSQNYCQTPQLKTVIIVSIPILYSGILKIYS